MVIHMKDFIEAFKTMVGMKLNLTYNLSGEDERGWGTNGTEHQTIILDDILTMQNAVFLVAHDETHDYVMTPRAIPTAVDFATANKTLVTVSCQGTTTSCLPLIEEKSYEALPPEWRTDNPIKQTKRLTDNNTFLDEQYLHENGLHRI